MAESGKGEDVLVSVNSEAGRVGAAFRQEG